MLIVRLELGRKLIKKQKGLYILSLKLSRVRIEKTMSIILREYIRRIRKIYFIILKVSLNSRRIRRRIYTTI